MSERSGCSYGFFYGVVLSGQFQTAVQDELLLSETRALARADEAARAILFVHFTSSFARAKRHARTDSLNRAVNIYPCACSSSRSLADGRANGLDRRAAFLPRLSKRNWNRHSNYISLYFNFTFRKHTCMEIAKILRLLISNNLF